MRKGVWTQEEEAFALKLMEEFKEGRLPEISPKCTIRKLLEKKFHCAGMRISKKFGGQCFGKVTNKFPFQSIYEEMNLIFFYKIKNIGPI
jgi:hypothetical protein